jgi:hypothetical protein
MTEGARMKKRASRMMNRREMVVIVADFDLVIGLD